MKRDYLRTSIVVAAVAVLALGLATVAAATTSKTQVSGQISADGSSTVGPFVQAAAQRFERRNRGARVVVGISGTGGGFERFCKGEIDLANASRAIKLTEAKTCQDNGVQYIQFLLVNDGLSVVVNKNASWVSCLTADELKKVWDKGSKVDNWNDVRPSFPDVPMKLYGPGTDSGTFDFFTEKINGKSRQSRSDYSASEDDNVTVRGVSGERGGMGYFGLSYYTENKSKLKLLRIHNGSRCVAPSVASVQAGSYRPLSRPLFVYAKKDSVAKPEVSAFVEYTLDNAAEIAEEAQFVPLTAEQVEKAQADFQAAG